MSAAFVGLLESWAAALSALAAAFGVVYLLVATLLLFLAGPFVLWPLIRTPEEE